VEPLVSATEEVFDTMLAIPLARQAPFESTTPVPADVVATVAFAGHRRGLVVYSSSMDAGQGNRRRDARHSAGDRERRGARRHRRDSHMIAGTFRNRLAAVEPTSAIAVPTVTVGSDFSTMYISAVRRVRCPFEMKGLSISVELILTGEDAGGTNAS
jgi:CheY-specific phosphatase CheX